MPGPDEWRWGRLIDTRWADILGLVVERIRATPALASLDADLLEVAAAVLAEVRERVLAAGAAGKPIDYRRVWACVDEVTKKVADGSLDLGPLGAQPDAEVGRRLSRERQRLEWSRDSASPIVDELNRLGRGRKVLRLCTPSIVLGQARVEDILGADVSVSYTGGLGSPLEYVDGTGAFADLARFVTRLYGGDVDRDQGFLLTNGSTGANWTIGVYLQRLLGPGERVLVSRGAHISLPQALTDLKVHWDYLPGAYDQRWEAVGPATPDDVAAAAAAADVRAVCLNGPTYEGVFLDVAAVRHALDGLRRDDGSSGRDVLLVVDEAWGAHLPFDQTLARRGAFAQGADIVNASSHKQGGALQGTAVLVARGERVDLPALQGAFQSVASTSPSYQLLASMDAAYRLLAADEGRLIGRSVMQAEQLAAECSARAEAELFGRADTGEVVDGMVDPLKVTVRLPPPCVGISIAETLEDQCVVVEKSAIETLTFLLPFQLTEQMDEDPIERVISEFAAAVLQAAADPELDAGRASLGDPFGAGSAKRVMPGHEAARLRFGVEAVTYQEAVGSVAAERVAAYPPGVPILSEGYEISKAEADYLDAVAAAGGHIVSNGGSAPGSVKVVPSGDAPVAR